MYTVPAGMGLPDKIMWSPEYLSPTEFILILGQGLSGLVTVDLIKFPTFYLAAVRAVEKPYHNCSKDFIIVPDFGPVENGAAMICTMMLFGEFLAAKGILDSDIVPSSIVFTATTPDSSRDEYRLIRRRLIEPYIRTGRLRIERECPNAGGWYSIILEPDTDNLEDVVRDMETEHGT